jgi:hypothetical protein
MLQMDMSCSIFRRHASLAAGSASGLGAAPGAVGKMSTAA